MRRLRIRHRSSFAYVEPVTLGQHRLMLRPRDSHVSRLLDARLAIAPEALLRWEYDVFGNSVAVASFTGSTRRLTIDSTILIDHYGLPADGPELDAAARSVPLVYPAAEAPDLAPFVARSHPDPERQVEFWARSLLGADGTRDTLAFLHATSAAIGTRFRYAMRFDAGTQPPATTLALGSGTCRDLALLMMETVRCVGLAARFVSGYLHGTGGDAAAHGLPHAWLEVYLPGAGWLEFDPTNGLAGSDRLIRVAVARDADQAMPVKGSFLGTPGACCEAIVSVEIEPAADEIESEASPPPALV